MISIIDAMTDAECFGPWFEGESWAAWKAILKAAFALPMTPAELITFGELAGGRSPPMKRVRELWVAAGRRAGKDSIASLVATFAAAIEQAHLGRLRPGELAVVQCLAVDRDQARIVLSYIKAFFDAIPDLGAMIVRETRFGLKLNNGVSIEVTTNNFRQARGRTVLLAVLDEVSFYRSDDSATPDFEVYRAVTPGLATLPDSMLVGISSPYRKAGLLYEKWKTHYGKDSGDVLVLQASSRQLNPTLDAALVERALQEDPASARSEWLGQWRDDIGAFVPLELIESAVDVGVLVRPTKPGVTYFGFVDAASGVGQDSFAIAIAHKDENEVVLDLAHEVKPPFSPDQAIGECSSLLKGFGLRACTGDKYSAGFVIEGFQRQGITYSYSERDRSAIYVECCPCLPQDALGSSTTGNSLPNSRALSVARHRWGAIESIMAAKVTTICATPPPAPLAWRPESAVRCRSTSATISCARSRCVALTKQPRGFFAGGLAPAAADFRATCRGNRSD